MTKITKQPDRRLQAVVVDMSEVLIRTTAINKAAWEMVFNRFFELNNLQHSFAAEDYHTWFEGSPKFDRVRDFLSSRGLTLPFGNQSDHAGYESICGLEKKRSKKFSHLLRKGQFHVYEKAVESLKLWKEKGLKTALVSSDENFRKVFRSSEFTDLFDVLIDGHSTRKMGLKEKPEADLYKKAARKLDLEPESCILIDDSIPGMQAGSKANFGLVVGINRRNNRKMLSENGADLVIEHFDELDLFNDPQIEAWFETPIAPFASEYVKIGQAVFDRTPVLFLDYDGTLTPIVQHPEDAVISQEMKEVLQDCAGRLKVAAVSGRDMDDLKSRINIPDLIYAGSHGFRISGPGGLYMEHEKTREILPELDAMEDKLNRVFEGKANGVKIERKRYAIAVHYRNAGEKEVPLIRETVYGAVEGTDTLKIGEGKKIFEIKPALDWHKGKAVLWILDKLGMTDKEKYIPIYIGDDVTDEDAYKAIKGWGIGIQVGPGAIPTEAEYRLKNIYQVRIFIKELGSFLV